MNKKTSYLLAITTMMFWGTAFPFSKLIIDQGIHPVVFLTLRMGFAFVFLLGYLLISHQVNASFQMIRRHFWKLAGLGVILYTGSYMIQYIGVQYTTAINQTVISNTSTFAVIIFNYLFYRRKPSKIFLISMIMGFIGVLFIILDDGFQLTSATLLGDILTIIAFFLWGLYIVVNRSISLDEKPIYITFSTFLWTTVSLVPLSFGFDIVQQVQQMEWSQWGIIAYLGIVCSGITTLMYTMALSNEKIPSENIAIIGFLLPVVGIIFSVLLLDEGFSWQDLMGCVLVVISVFIVERRQKLEPNIGQQAEIVH